MKFEKIGGDIMYLARVEMTGFKSFADKTVIEFGKGLTAVVGPNGSGKSNLSEAIRWVLGEQSAKSLRGSKMEDVIFNGTQDRKAVNLAKVTLVLNNEDRYLDYDFSEISITRSYNRNGESNYYINNESVRLKDIVDLLLDSGLGKNSFAMISQGKVESIFLNKPEERRSIFEEAAGVQKYQLRKAEAERKLIKSEDHLSRVKDIIHELEGQIKPLKKQRETALKYQTYQEELSSLEISLYTHQIEQNRLKWDEAQVKLSNVDQAIQLDEEELTRLSETINEQQQMLDDLLISIDRENETHQELVRKVEQAKAKYQMLQQELQFNQANTDEKTLQFENQLVQKERIQENLAKQSTSKVTLETAIEQLTDKMSQLETERKLAAGLSDDQVETLRSEMIQFYQSEASAKNEVNQLEQQIEQQTMRLKRAKNKHQMLKETLASSETELKELETSLELKEATQKMQNEHHQSLQQEWQTLQQKRNQIQKELFAIERQVNTLNVRVNSLKQMQEQYDGYYGGVKFIMQHAKDIGGINGTVAELIHVKPEFQLAIDTALGGSLQHIVVEDDQSARKAIAYLKEHRAGRATFLPRPNIKGRSVQDYHLQTAQKHAGYIGIGHQLVAFDEINQAIIENLLGNTIVMDTIVNAQSLSKQLRHQVKIVTLEGDILMPGGSITGGRQRNQQTSMLSRQTDLEKALIELEAATNSQKSMITKIDQIEELEQSVRENGEASLNQVNQINHEVNQQKQALQQFVQQVKINQNELKVAQMDIDEAEQFINQSQAKLTEAQETIRLMTQKIAEGTQQLEQMNVSQADRQKKIEQLNHELSQLNTEKAVKQSELRQIKTQVEQLTAQLVQLNEFIENYQNNQLSSEQDLNQLKETIMEVESQIETLNNELVEHTTKLDQSKQNRSEWNQNLRDLENKKVKIQQQQQAQFKLQAKLQAQIEKFKELIDNHLNYLNENYQLSYEAASQQAQTDLAISEVSSRVKELRKAIDNLGPINLAAIEDFENLNERYTYLLEQQEDLLTAMGQLKDTMDAMDAEVIKRFSESFHQINHQFKRTFKSLFGGGEASLELTDPDNLLTTGVDIIAQPPGKRKQNLALLSGGERAFTAIALLFAILETKPVPFCVLDEVEAALDDANVYRYGEYLQQFTENTQFIVITHRKGTMEHADVLYGVTMERSGVSKLASVRLSEANIEE